MRTSARTALVLFAVGSSMLALTACSNSQPNQEPTMSRSSTPSGSTGAASGAKSAWDDLNQKVESTQAMVGGEWEASDTGATACGSSGAQWGITRLGPGASPGDRERIIDEIETAWKANGWKPTRTKIGGDAPGLQLRYPAAGTFDDGFFIELGITDYGSSMQSQTPCEPGDADALNDEQYAYNHQNTTRLPSDSPSSS
ncbi:hypothetical protein [Curtobacterium sp. Leaf261]|uniref:hypothetical protein n=1 Tax=Curtobacterium sp. Leaf261 TaxID=1736311 RepID=UPI0006FBA997|nr:hypothetical protein [Curtobacterium sp. Leaf261]KQO59968.1 hypothetical protein ASF23_15050 [Curtobacterium sp. Leaf261]